MPFMLALTSALFLLAAAGGAADEPWFCRGTPCPNYKVESVAQAYETRKYGSATWASVNVSGVESDVLLAILKGEVALTKYQRGANIRHEKVARGTPRAVLASPRYKYTEMGDTFSFEIYLPDLTEASAPKPDSGDVHVFDSPGGAKVHVHQFGGIATTGSILSSAAKLATALDADGLKYDESAFLFMAYNGAWPLTGRHNEIWMWAPENAPFPRSPTHFTVMSA